MGNNTSSPNLFGPAFSTENNHEAQRPPPPPLPFLGGDNGKSEVPIIGSLTEQIGDTVGVSDFDRALRGQNNLFSSAANLLEGNINSHQ
jgi:hypothetical protein